MKPRRGQTAGDNPKLECQTLRIVVTSVIAAVVCPAFAQEARLVNVKMQTHAVTSGLEKEFQSLVKEQV